MFRDGGSPRSTHKLFFEAVNYFGAGDRFPAVWSVYVLERIDQEERTTEGLAADSLYRFASSYMRNIRFRLRLSWTNRLH